jgi:peptidoglycan/LPS O-acetylase OafA/YrhL
LPRRGDVQGLRALAILLVVAYHAGGAVPGGYIGVDVFFVISGYVIGRMLLAEAHQTGRVDLARFYVRRVRRILPALALMSSVVVVACVALGPTAGAEPTASTGAFASLFNANTYLMSLPPGRGYFDVAEEVNVLLHTWSLSVEEQFYLVFPALLLGAVVLGRRAPAVGARVAVLLLLAGVVAVSLALCWVASTGRAPQLAGAKPSAQFAFYASPARAWEFAAGCVLAAGASRLATLGAGISGAMAATGSVLIVYAALTFDDATVFPGSAALVPVAGTMLLIAAGECRAGNRVSRWLAVPPAQFVGDLSYGWYLWHLPLMVFAAALVPRQPTIVLVGAVVALVVAWLSYRLVENPIRAHPRPAVARTAMLGAVCLLVPLLAVGAAHALRRHIADGTDMPPLPLHLDVTRGCSNDTPLDARRGDACVWRTVGSAGTAVLVGDSNAGQFTEPFAAAMNESRHDAIVATYARCPFVDLIVEQLGDDRLGCREFVNHTLGDLVARRPSLVAIASASSWYIEDDQFTLTDPVSGESHRDVEDKAAMWRVGLRRVVEPLTAAGVDVVLVHPVPRFDGFDLNKCATIWWLVDAARCGMSIERADAERFRARSLAAEAAVARETGATTIDPLPLLCPGDECRTHRGTTWLWRDMGHISVAAAPLLLGSFRDAMSPTCREAASNGSRGCLVAP